MRIPARWFVNQVSVQTCTGSGSYGPIYATAATLGADVSDKMQLVLNGAGVQELASRVFRFDATNIAAVTPGSLITFGGQIATVIAVQQFRKFGTLIYIEAITT